MLMALALAAGTVHAQTNPPVTPPPGPVNSPGAPAATASPAPGSPAPATPAPDVTPEAPGASPDSTTPPLIPTPTPVPLIADPPAPSVEPNKSVVVRLSGVFGTIVATSADPAIADVAVDQLQRTIFITGHALGTATITIKDDRLTVTRDVQVRVAYAAGSPADETSLRVTGNPATAAFLREAAADAAARAATKRPGATVTTFPDALTVRSNLLTDDRTTIDVPVQISGDGFITVNGVTRVNVENFALPKIAPFRLLVSDFPERLTANGVLFTADLNRREAQRFLYYHYNPGTEPARRILLKITNPAAVPATVQFISGSAGPGANEAEVGHLSTQRFLVHELQNEGTVVTIPPNSTVNLVDHALPPGNVVSALLQLREVDGSPVHLALVAQDAKAPLDQSIDTTQLLAGGAAHARGEYQVPEFFFDYAYDVAGDNLEIPIGQLPLPNLRVGEALSGDYGVKQSVTVRIVNSGRAPASVAIYANPRGGRATGTFLIDRTLVQAHALAAFSKYKIWQATVRPGTFQMVQIVTMPEGGSSYPLRLIFAPDDGSVPPGAPGSPIY
jgi:hypothetical protein